MLLFAGNWKCGGKILENLQGSDFSDPPCPIMFQMNLFKAESIKNA